MTKAKKSRHKARRAQRQTPKVTHIVIPETQVTPDTRLRWLVIMCFGMVAALLAWGLIGVIARQRQMAQPDSISKASLESQYHQIHQEALELAEAQTHSNYVAVDRTHLQRQLTVIRADIDSRHQMAAIVDIKTFQEQLRTYNNLLAAHIAKQKSLQTTGVEATTINVPILLYHYTPTNFEAQLNALEAKHYKVITLDTLDAALHGRSRLPIKSVIITFDDGFSNQMTAFELLQRHHMPATYYIINAGERSQWCIGAGRRIGDPLQPPSGCGDSYLNWDQVRQLDQSGLITIASHTVDHQNLAKLPPEEQLYEISEGKRGLEAQLGHPVRHFAYPYGGFNDTTISIVKNAGFATAVSTIPGSTHTLGSEYSLHRVRDVDSLP